MKLTGQLVRALPVAAVLALPASTALPQTPPSLAITSPATGAIFSNGQIVSVQVATSSGANFSTVLLAAQDVGLVPPLTTSSYTFSLPIAVNSAGPRQLVAVGTIGSSQVIYFAADND